MVNAALGTEDGISSIYKIGFSNSRWATGLTSFNREVLEKAFTSGYVSRQSEKEGVKIPADWNDRVITQKVEVITVSTLLARYEINGFNVLQIDTEGYDFEILKMFDFSKIQPELIIYENDHLSESDKNASICYLEEYGYSIKNFGGNTAALLKKRLFFTRKNPS